MIERLLAAFAEGAADGGGTGPRPGAGVEEIADILWLAARVDPAGARPPGAPAAEPGDGQPPAAEPAPPEEAPPDPVGGPAAADPGVQLYPAAVPVRAGTAKPADAATGRRGTPLRLPRAGSLDDPLGLMRSLRPVGRRSIGGPGEELDEQLSVETSIERMVPTPVLRPAESRWLDLALVVDTHHSMLLWADLVDELRRVLTRSGVFRDVRTWQLTGTGSGATPMVTRGRGGPPRNPLELADPAGRRLLLVLSDTVAGGWCEAPLQAVLRQWSAHNAVAVLNVLPERLWSRGAVRPAPYAVRADRPAAATRSWQRLPAARRARRRRASRSIVPVVGLASASLARLLRVVSGDGRWRRLACLSLDAQPGVPAPPDDPAPPVVGLEAVERFRANASPTAQQLAAHLAAVPLTLPVMTLVRRSLLRDSEHGHLAEVALGGLLAPWDRERAADEVEFEFLPGVREALLGSQLRGEVAAVRELVRRRVWEYMSRNRGPGPDFSATRVTNGREGRRPVPDDALPFAARPGAGLPEPGLADRVVRVRYDTMVEPQEVGTLLTPRLVLTVGDALLPWGTVVWVRAGGREVPCRPVWSEGALPRVYLLLADEDVVDPAVLAERLPWAQAEAGPGRVRVDGLTDQGERVALTGEVLPSGGAANAELVRLSTEPESWTHYRGGPVSRDGELIGVVHGIWPDRMVFLSGQALLEQPGFQGVMTASHSRGRSGAAGDPDATVCLAVGFRASRPQRGNAGSPYDAVAEVAGLLGELSRDIGAAGRLIESPGGVLLLVLEGPGALVKAGRILTALPARARWFLDSHAPWIAGLDVAASTGEHAFEDGQAAVAAVRRRREPLIFALSQPLNEELGSLLGPVLPPSLYPRNLAPLGGESEGKRYTGDLSALGYAMVEAGETRSGGLGWQHCGVAAGEGDRLGCIGIRLPGYDRCLAHLARDDRDAYLRALGPRSPVDFRGTVFDNGLIQQLLRAVQEPGTQSAELGPAAFDRAHFVGDWSSSIGIVFSGRASFDRAVFSGRARFTGASFTGPVSFDGAVFRRETIFVHSHFQRSAAFRRAVFSDIGFGGATFRDEVSFERAVFEEPSEMSEVKFAGPADFTGTIFRDVIGMHGTVFSGPAFFSQAVWERGLLSTGAEFKGPAAFDYAEFQGPVRFERVRFDANTEAELPFSGEPDRWIAARHPDGSWDIRLLGPEAEEEGSGSGA
ncbi:pentapeptide repeat-containing protein [Streptomyces sp. NPDC091371]|uniref:pentapeptide repeat-containing protein n=1 Tax=Streptomyces sp. NPDC091371 TaxID=3155303 RepID=UPI00342F5281